jgi:hypothetical protein
VGDSSLALLGPKLSLLLHEKRTTGYGALI